jgi:hypothetical protein
MAMKAKGATHTEHQPGAPKTTSIGQGARSRPRRKGKKKLRGQGR